MRYRLKEILAEKNITQDQLAEMAIVSKSRINHICNGANTTVALLEEIAAALNINIKELFP